LDWFTTWIMPSLNATPRSVVSHFTLLLVTAPVAVIVSA
jgi:hypothetical protein